MDFSFEGFICCDQPVTRAFWCMVIICYYISYNMSMCLQLGHLGFHLFMQVRYRHIAGMPHIKK